MTKWDPRHVWTVVRLNEMLIRRGMHIVSVGGPLLLDDASILSPDLTLLDPGAPRDQYPSPEHTRLVIEVAGRTVWVDRCVKGPLYAKAGIAEYWIVDLNGERIEVYREPSQAGYRAMRFVVRGEHLSPVFAADMRVEVDAVLGPAGQTMDDEAEATEAP